MANDSNERCTEADLEIMGGGVGAAIAKATLKREAKECGARQRRDDLLAAARVSAVEGFVFSQRLTNGLTDGGEAAFRRGFERGLQSQFANPDAKIVFNKVKA